jgi:hypothetical protein
MQDMRDFREAKAMARTLRAALAARGFNITISQSLELIAEAFGVADWNTLAAAIRQEATTERDGTSRPQQANAGWATSPSFSVALGLTLHRALAYANQRDYEYATLEHLQRNPKAPTIVRIQHHKTRAIVLHPLEERLPDGSVIEFYEEAEAVLSHLKKRGTPMILREVDEDEFKPFSFSGMQKIVQRMRKELALPAYFTLGACRHGGLTELEEAELTDGQGRALSAHRTQESYEGYAKRHLPRALSATRKRYAHVLVNASETKRQNEAVLDHQNENQDDSRSA